MYGDNYGYRSGLNKSMVRHLTQKIRELERLAELKPGDTVLDIGSNDATSLKAYSVPSISRIGIDPPATSSRNTTRTTSYWCLISSRPRPIVAQAGSLPES